MRERDVSKLGRQKSIKEKEWEVERMEREVKREGGKERKWKCQSGTGKGLGKDSKVKRK